MSIAAAEILPDKRVTSFVKERRKLLIGGQWVDAASGKTFPVQNPATGEVIAHVAEGDRQDIDRAVKAARRAFESGAWPRLTPSERGRLVWKLGDLILEHLEELAELDPWTMGNPLPLPAQRTCHSRRIFSIIWPDGPPRLRATPSQSRCPTHLG